MVTWIIHQPICPILHVLKNSTLHNILTSCSILLTATNSKSAALRHYARYTSCKFSSNNNAVSNITQEITHNEPLLDQIQAGMREEEAR
jgi:hypothetical protein